MTPVCFEWSRIYTICMYIFQSVYMYIQGVYIYIQSHPYTDNYCTEKGRDFLVFKQNQSRRNQPFTTFVSFGGVCIYG